MEIGLSTYIYTQENLCWGALTKKIFVMLSRFWPLSGWGLLKRENSWQKYLFQIMLNKVPTINKRSGGSIYLNFCKKYLQSLGYKMYEEHVFFILILFGIVCYPSWYCLLKTWNLHKIINFWKFSSVSNKIASARLPRAAEPWKFLRICQIDINWKSQKHNPHQFILSEISQKAWVKHQLIFSWGTEI